MADNLHARTFQSTMVALDRVPGASSDTSNADAATVTLYSPAVGLWRDAPAPGSLVTPGSCIGALEILGRLHRLQAPAGAYGIATLPDDMHDYVGSEMRVLARRPVAYGTVLLVLDSEGVIGARADQLVAQSSSA